MANGGEATYLLGTAAGSIHPGPLSYGREDGISRPPSRDAPLRGLWRYRAIPLGDGPNLAAIYIRRQARMTAIRTRVPARGFFPNDSGFSIRTDTTAPQLRARRSVICSGHLPYQGD